MARRASSAEWIVKSSLLSGESWECCNGHLAGCSVHLVQRCLQEMQPRILPLFSFFCFEVCCFEVFCLENGLEAGCSSGIGRSSSSMGLRLPHASGMGTASGLTSTEDGIGGTGCLALAFFALFALLFLFASLYIPTRNDACYQEISHKIFHSASHLNSYHSYPPKVGILSGLN